MIQIISIASYCDHLESWYCDKPKAKASAIQRRSSLGAAWRNGTCVIESRCGSYVGGGASSKYEPEIGTSCWRRGEWSTSVQLWLFPVPRELQSPSPWGHCSSSLSPPTKTAQSQLEIIAPLAEGGWGRLANALKVPETWKFCTYQHWITIL